MKYYELAISINGILKAQFVLRTIQSPTPVEIDLDTRRTNLT